MDLKEYQEVALKRFERWVAILHETRGELEEQVGTLREASVDESIIKEAENYPKQAWKKISKETHIDRFDSADRPIPHTCLKVPTGGGKTLMAADALRRLGLRNGLVLWVVPTKQIYAQTKNAIRRKDSPIRQRLEHGSGGRVKFMEKDDPFNNNDAGQCLCVMPLMLAAVNREKNRNFLLMNHDSGAYQSFFPDADDAHGNASLLKYYPDLERHQNGMIKHSLTNVFKMMRPVVILDEAHKAYRGGGREYVGMINQLDPSLVVEMSATPNRTISNLLVDVKGRELWDEEMIKMPIDLNVQTDSDWRHMVHVAYTKLQSLEEDAKALQGRYIRPITVIRVERTGKDQRGGGFIHADDVKEYLERTLGVPADHIATQSSTMKELEGKDLMSDTSPIRYIITKDALKEGWDCPFAYVLVILDNIKASTAVTQLIGRVLRQPGASSTGIESLDRCYVYCHHKETGKAAGYVKSALDGLGMGDMARTIAYADPDKPDRKPKSQRVPGNVFLPVVLHKDKDSWKGLDYNSHILPSVDFGSIHAPDPKKFGSKKQGWVRHEISLEDESDTKRESRPHDSKSAGVADLAGHLYGIMPNIWQAARISQEFLVKLYDSGKTAQEVYNSLPYISKVLCEHVAAQINLRAERIFRDKLKRGIIRFDLEMNDRNYKIKNYDIQKGRLLQRDDGTQVQRTLLEPVYEEEFDTALERDFARYLDESEAVKWWHRVAAQQRDGYHLAGWRKSRVYPDFIVMTNEAGDKARLGIYDTKGEQLEGNLDTKYKESLLKTLQGAFDCGKVRVNGFNMRGEFRLVFDGQFDEILVEDNKVVSSQNQRNHAIGTNLN